MSDHLTREELLERSDHWKAEGERALAAGQRSLEIGDHELAAGLAELAGSCANLSLAYLKRVQA